MGWGTEFTAEVFLSRQKYDTTEEIKDKIQEHKDLIEMSKEELLIGTSIKPTMLKEEPDDSIVRTIRQHVINNIENIKEAEIEIFKLELLLDNFEGRVVDD